MFTASAMDIESLRQLNELDVPFIKIGSGDANNIPLLEEAAALRRPLVISTGMQTDRMIRRIVSVLAAEQHTDYALLHCVSAYPTQPTEARLHLMDKLQQRFTNVCIGYSGHERGIAISLASVVMGAKVNDGLEMEAYVALLHFVFNEFQIVERHFTLDRDQKGTDHQISLTPSTLKTVVEYIHRIDVQLTEMANTSQKTKSPIFNTKESLMLVKDVLFAAKIPVLPGEIEEIAAALAPISDDEPKELEKCELLCWQKLGKSLVYCRSLPAGHVLQSTDIGFKVSPIKGLLDEDYDAVVGNVLNRDVTFEDPVVWAHLESH